LKLKVYSIVLLMFICIILSICINYRESATFFRMNKKIPIYSVATDEKKVAITFDTSWGKDNTMAILDILEKYKVKATFFIIGKWANEFPNEVKQISIKGHEIGNHSYRHPNITVLSSDEIKKEIRLTDEKIFELTGQTTKIFRCPEGSYNDLVVKTAESTGKYCIQWDVDSIDWREEGADIEYKRVIKKTKPGSIILFHNNAKYTPENLPKIIEKLQKDGYEFVIVSDLIYKNNYYLNNEGKQIQNKTIVN
jgi:peptidoglycan-N-acetylglucosamine deacetylase